MSQTNAVEIKEVSKKQCAEITKCYIQMANTLLCEVN